MIPSQSRQRGEGKVGCIVSLLVLGSLTAAAFKAVPIYWSDNELKDAAKDIASRASVLKTEAIELQLRTKAKDLEIGEAMVPGAIRARKTGDGTQGTCTITLNYKRKIDLYGVYTWVVAVDASIAAPYLGGL
jgi:Tfp pilus assembly major pilin PilA